MLTIGNANPIELVRLVCSAAALFIHIRLIVAAKADLAALAVQGARNGRIIQAEADVTKHRILAAVQGIFLLALLNAAVRVPDNPFAHPADIVFTGICYLVIQMLLCWLAVHMYRTRARLLGIIIRWWWTKAD